MKSFLALILLFISQNSFAKDCITTFDKKSVVIAWKAFKMPAKVGVGGKLKNFEIKGKLNGKSAADVLKNVFFTISTTGKSVNTKNPARDMKIEKAFFSTLKNDGLMVGSFTKVTKDKLIMALTLNGVSKDIPLALSLKKGKLQANGHIDVLDFAMSSQLKALTKACFAKHEGKTWSDVEISLSANFTRSCK